MFVYPTPVTKGSAHSQPPATDATAADEAQAVMRGASAQTEISQTMESAKNASKALTQGALRGGRWGRGCAATT